MNLAPFANTIWLAEPTQFAPVVSRVMGAGRCYTPREVAEARQHAMASIDGFISGALQSTGKDWQPLPAATHKTYTAEEKAEIRREWDALSRGQQTDHVEILPQSEAPKAIRAVKGKVGVIPVWGPVQQRMSSELMKAGGTPLDFISRAFDRMMADPSIGAIVMHFDSPGGSSFGVEELSTKIYNARGTKPIYAMADSVAASAAYWLATSADMVICTPSGLVGSVGVYVMHVSEEKALADAGLAVSLVSAGKYKTELASHLPLSDDAKANLQRHVDTIHDAFIGSLKRNRNTTVENVRTNYGQGRVLNAADALASGMIDRILSYEDLLSRLTGGGSAGVSGAGMAASAPDAQAAMDMMRMRSKWRSVAV